MSNNSEELSKYLRESGKINEDESVKVVSLDDTFKFNCIRCGKCCSCRSDIILSPFDIYQMAKALNTTTKEVITKYCNISYGNNSGLPIITLASDERNLCPFLKFSVTEGKFGCSINTHKPGVCIMHPVGVARKLDLETKENQGKDFMMVPACNNNTADVEHKVRDFIKPYLDNEAEHDMASELQFEIGRYIDTRKMLNVIFSPNEEYMENNLTPEERENIKSIASFSRTMFVGTFLTSVIKTTYTFDTDMSFMEQVDMVKRGIRLNALNALCTANLLVGIDFRAKGFPEDAEEELKYVSDTLEKHAEQSDPEEVKKFIKEFIKGIAGTHKENENSEGEEEND